VVTHGGHLVLRDVTFGYEPGRPILRGVDLEVRPGEVVALVGRTGAGKTSICGLLTRAYDGYTGSITLDGAELSRLDPHAVRRQIGAVRQDVQLFGDTVRFNLTLGRDLPDARVWEAVAAMRASDVVDRLGGLDGRISQAGKNLSAGEGQLLALARVMLHDPPIVLLDEATASVDPRTEQRVQEATAELFQRKTTIVIAHRLATILHADRIVLLESGRVMESGTHAELLAANGAYAALFAQQFAEALE
jgi:ATP-binding cassette subfamily B protein